MSGNWLLVEMNLSFKDEGQRFIPEYQGTLTDDINPWRMFVQEAEVEGEGCGHSHGLHVLPDVVADFRPIHSRCCRCLSWEMTRQLFAQV